MSSDQDTQDREDGSEPRGEEKSASEKAKQEAEEREQAEQELKELEDDPPTDLSEWPDGKGKYLTFGGPEGERGYEDGPTAKLGASEVRHHEDGTVTVSGEEVDDPEKYKGEPIPGGPTDPNSPDLSGEGGKSGDEDDDGPASEHPGPGSQNGRQAEDDEDES